MAGKARTDPRPGKLPSDAIAKAARSPEFKAYLKEQYADEASFIPGVEATKYMQGWLEDAKKVIASIPRK